jgi:hypothetical protein
MRTGALQEHVALRKLVVVVAAVTAAAAPTALAASGATPNPMGMLLAKSEVPGAPYDRTQTLRPAQLKPEVLGRTISFGARSAAYRAAAGSTCAARYFTTDTASGKKQAFSYVCVTGSAADAKALAKAFIAKRKEFLRQPAQCQAVSPGLGQSSGIFRWCPYKPGGSFWATSFLGIWSSGKVVALYGHEYPELEKRPGLNDVLPGLRRLNTRIKAAG